MEKDNLKIIQEEAEKIFKLLTVEATVKLEEKEDGVIEISLESSDSGLLIGYHGQTLAALQLVFNLIIYKKLGQWTKIIFNIGDWRQRREEYLKDLALRIAQEVETRGEPVFCPYLTASERRVVHLVLQDHPQVETESQGEGEDRRLVIKPKA